MKGTRYTEEHILRILGEVEGGRGIAAGCRQYAVAEATVQRWRSGYKGVDQASLRRLKELEAENARLKKIVAQQAVDLDALKDLLGKEW